MLVLGFRWIAVNPRPDTNCPLNPSCGFDSQASMTTMDTGYSDIHCDLEEIDFFSSDNEGQQIVKNNRSYLSWRLLHIKQLLTYTESGYVSANIFSNGCFKDFVISYINSVICYIGWKGRWSTMEERPPLLYCRK